MNTNTNSPWFKQIWPWFIISFPLLTVIAGIITYYIAADNPVSLVQDNYFKEGLAINQVIHQQKKAKELNISATLNAEKTSQLLFVTLASTNINITSLQVIFSHPTQEKLDKQIIFDALGFNEFAAQLPDLPQAKWHVQLIDKNNGWLLKGRWNYPQKTKLILKSQPVKVEPVQTTT